ncbi:hypothetical protein [Streptomyces murinus]|uniref:hypothetical protein n=1 Tax=Streptomyces murinus TaxID=33900 RepID=UPI0037F3FACD
MNTVYVATIGDYPTVVAPTLELAQAEALAAETKYQRDGEWEHRWDESRPGKWRLMQRQTSRKGRYSWTRRTVHTVDYVTEAGAR